MSRVVDKTSGAPSVGMGALRSPLRVLLLEDSENDAILLLRALDEGGYDVVHRRVETAEAMRLALISDTWDIILSDYSMPALGAMAALELLGETGIDMPFLILSGSIGEEAAIGALKAGADDFLPKSQLARFVPAVGRELRKAETRREGRRAEQALRESELKYRRIVETAQEGIWMIDAAQQTTYMNHRMAEMLGSTPEVLLGASLFEFMKEEWKEGALRSVERRRTGASGHLDFTVRRRDGSEFSASLASNAILDDEGRYLGALAMVTDVTEQRRLQEQLMVSDRMASIGTLAAGVAHEINNPLTAVLGNLQLATAGMVELRNKLGELANVSELHAGLVDALEAAERVRHIVRDLKVFSRAEDETRSSVDVEHIIESSLRIAWPEIRCRARLVKNFQALPPVLANESRIGQVCLNLLVNAAQSIEEGHADTNEIAVSTWVDGHKVVIEIRDTGAGMPPAVLRRLFTPFFTTKSVGVGTGLGLSICHRIVSSLGGQITVESVVGKGSAFRVSLPAAPSSVRPPVAASLIPSAGRRGRILVIDDEPMILSMVRRVLGVAHEVETMTSAREAIARVAAGSKFDVIISDLMMPDMTGMDLYAELFQLDADLAESVIFLTGGAFTPRARAFLDEVANPRLEKPFRHQALETLVNERLQ